MNESILNSEMNKYKRILITGGAGFIGGTLIRRLLKTTNCIIYNIDCMGYASSLESIYPLKGSKDRHIHLKINLSDKDAVFKAVKSSDPDIIIHLAAETHVDRSIDSPIKFIESNVLGTFNLLMAALNHFNKLSRERKKKFKFQHISTDEVFGSLGPKGKFTEKTSYYPRSPYSASKASSDHLVRSWHYSYSLPILITNCSNNYGPYQFPEKLIPLAITKALKGEDIPLYGNGKNIRDWIYVEDHIDALILVAEQGQVGKTYCIGGNREKTNRDILELICATLDDLKPTHKKYSTLIKLVKDRPGNDLRYAIDSSLIKKELHWESKIGLKEGIKLTIKWYVNNLKWCNDIQESSGYKGERLGLNP